ncbi:hypothetical protein HK098_003241 [Nowakowskiella sp. JEL0407]|nr:hypothetical protein HK098_003241 [Nowakowskiella sp. JEL0407]
MRRNTLPAMDLSYQSFERRRTISAGIDNTLSQLLRENTIQPNSINSISSKSKNLRLLETRDLGGNQTIKPRKLTKSELPKIVIEDYSHYCSDVLFCEVDSTGLGTSDKLASSKTLHSASEVFGNRDNPQSKRSDSVEGLHAVETNEQDSKRMRWKLALLKLFGKNKGS